jgi:hypothetical protein
MPARTISRETAAKLRYEREKRIMDAIQLKIPDRVPIIAGGGYFPAKYVGIPFSAAYYDYKAWYAAYKKTLPEFPADMVFHQGFTPGKALEILDSKQLRWPGHGVSPWHGHQSIEIENMQPEDYEAFLDDPSDYTLRRHLARFSDKLKGLAGIPKLSDLMGPAGAQALALALTSKEGVLAVRTLQQTGREIRRWQNRVTKFNDLLLELGFPQYFQGFALPPFDIISHSMRGMTGTIADMYRRPDKVLATCDKILELTLKRPMPKPSPLGYMRYFMTNTRGSDDFLSPRHFERFYWPTFKTLVMTLIERGATPCIFLEGNFSSRLEYLLQFPKGKILARLDTTDIFKAKEVLRNHACIQGNVPSILLQAGTVQEVKDHCKKLIDAVGEGGGFILSPRSSTDEVNPENFKAMIEFTQEYGRYR